MNIVQDLLDSAITGDIPAHKLLKPQGVVWHTTAGRGSVSALKSSLNRTRLSVHFGIDADGTIVQFLPLAQRSSHASTPKLRGASYPNANFLSVEICHPLTLKNAISLGCRDTFPPAVMRQKIGGAFYDIVPYTEKQCESIVQLGTMLSDMYQIPREVPLNADGTLRTTRLSVGELQSFKGHCGHMHMAATSKVDPGVMAFLLLREAWK